jgi:dihydrofolate synthase/folylpolyglutamate synthase
MRAVRPTTGETTRTPPYSPEVDADDCRFEAALERVMGLADFERVIRSPGHSSFHLERIGLLLRRLGDPHRATPTIHVAGSKGKGSTAAMMASILTAQGYKVGLYTSPHLHSVVERIRIGLTPIGRQEFAAIVERAWPAAQWVGERGGYGGVTTFELLTALAFLYFKREGTDLQIIEVGLGGRLDCTNVVVPEVSVITSISLDHTSILGDTVEQIAFEKAGIIKDGIPVVVAPQAAGTWPVFKEIAGQRHAPLVEAGALVSLTSGQATLDGQSFEVRGPRGGYSLSIPLLGDHQLENALTAIATLETLNKRGIPVDRKSIFEGLARVEWPGRMDVLSANGQLVAVDGAHNTHSMMRLAEAVQKYFGPRPMTLIFGALSGHTVDGMLSQLSRFSPSVIAVRSRHPRALPSGDIEAAASRRNLRVLFATESVADATQRALARAAPDELILGTGSLSVAAEVIEEVDDIPPEVYPNIKRAPVDSPNGARPG